MAVAAVLILAMFSSGTVSASGGPGEEDNVGSLISKAASHFDMTLPSSLSEGIVLDPVGDEPALTMTKLGIADGDSSVGVVAVVNELAAYPGLGSVVVAFEDGGYVLAEVIQDATSADTFQYEIVLGEGQSISDDGAGGYIVVNENGETVAPLAAPWAVDADGVDVPTSYTLDDEGVLALHVDHQAAEYAYPILTDPCWGWNCAKKVIKAAAKGAAIWGTGGAIGGCVTGAMMAGVGCGAGALAGGAGGAVGGGIASGLEAWFED